MASITVSEPSAPRPVKPQHLLYGLMIPGVLLPLTGWMLSVSLPIIRDDFGITADVASWIVTAFSLPFIIFLPIYGRLSDQIGKRRLLLAGIVVFLGGSLQVINSSTLPEMILGRVFQGLGAAGILPLSLALITEVFPSEKRGRAIGLWSTVGPMTGAIAPILAGLIVSGWGWRISFAPPAAFSVLSLLVIYFLIPAKPRSAADAPRIAIDYAGMGLLGLLLTTLLIFLSSRPVTGVPPLQDWRFLGLGVFFLAAFVWQENRSRNPFIRPDLLKNRSLLVASLSAGVRMLVMGGGLGFVLPLYLADVMDFDPGRSGLYLMLNPATMVVFTRLGGSFSDRWGSRIIVMTGFALTSGVMLGLSLINPQTPPWVLAGMLIFFGMGSGLMLASLHRAALIEVPESDLGTSSGIYSSIRFMGSALGAALGGILLQYYLQSSGSEMLFAYQHVFGWFCGFAVAGFSLATMLPKPGKSILQE
jgi:DHA2 family metal-tetracycline-proton antiporter-like MFS transporter